VLYSAPEFRHLGLWITTLSITQTGYWYYVKTECCFGEFGDYALSVVECVSRIDSHKTEQPWEEEASVKAHQLSSIEAVSSQFVQECREFANKPMPSLPKDFLKAAK